MKKSLDGDLIRTQKLSFIIRTVARRFPGHLLAWDFVKEHWSKLVQKWVAQRITNFQYSQALHLKAVPRVVLVQKSHALLWKEKCFSESLTNTEIVTFVNNIP